MIKIITIPDDIRDMVQKAHIERDARRDILVYLMENDINVSQERKAEYQKEYDEKYIAFEQAKMMVEKNYVIPATSGKALNWSLNYATCEVTITLPEDTN